jgi:hypothetical protein
MLHFGAGFLSLAPSAAEARAAIEDCYAQMPHADQRTFETKACQRMVSSYEIKYGPAPSLRRE